MQKMAPNSDHLPLMNKVEVFEHSLDETRGDDLAKILLLKVYIHKWDQIMAVRSVPFNVKMNYLVTLTWIRVRLTAKWRRG